MITKHLKYLHSLKTSLIHANKLRSIIRSSKALLLRGAITLRCYSLSTELLRAKMTTVISLAKLLPYCKRHRSMVDVVIVPEFIGKVQMQTSPRVVLTTRGLQELF